MQITWFDGLGLVPPKFLGLWRIKMENDGVDFLNELFQFSFFRKACAENVAERLEVSVPLSLLRWLMNQVNPIGLLRHFTGLLVAT